MNNDSARYVFISYSHADASLVQKVTADLQAVHVPVWTDQTGLAAGTPNWDQAIRDAIQGARAVLLVATPSSRVSAAVQGEVSVARSQKIRIIPLWADGTDWYDCVSLEMAYYHYLDFRERNYNSALPQLIQVLSETNGQNLRLDPSSQTAHTTASSAGQLSQILVDLGERTGRPAYSVLQAVGESAFDTLNDLYLKYLWNDYPMLSYGIAWVLASKDRGIRRFVAPWTWLAMGGSLTRVNEETAVHLYREWGGLPAETFGMVDKTHWSVVDMRQHLLPTVGLLTNNDPLARYVQDLAQVDSPSAFQAASRLAGFFKVFLAHVSGAGGEYHDTEGVVRISPTQSVIPTNYRHLFVLSGSETSYAGKTVVVETVSNRAAPSWL